MLAFVAAERREFDGVLRKAARVAKLDWPLRFACMAWLKGETVLLVADGPGPKLAGRAVQMVRNLEELRGIVSTGYCGALNPALELCDIFVATEIVGVAQTLSVPRSHSSKHPRTGKLLSIDHVVSTSAERAELHRTGADAVEMEAAVVAEKAAEWKVPFYCIRVVTDTVAEDFPLDFNQMRDPDGRFSRTRILRAALRRPGSVLPELLKVNTRCKDASQALGDFLVDAIF